MKSFPGYVMLELPTEESLEVEIYASSDPTSTPPAFVMTTAGTRVTSVASWMDGQWAETYGTDKWTRAITPTLGETGSLPVSSDSRYWLWSKTTVGSEVAIELCGTVYVAG